MITIRTIILIVFFSTSLVVGCDCEEGQLGRSLPPGGRVDTFQQADRSVIDILWVIDNSPTMRDVQDNLASNLISFFRFLDAGHVDYQIAVTTTDVRRHGGILVGSPQIITPQTPEVIRAFRGNVHVGIDGSAREEGLNATELIFDGHSLFPREDAYVFIVWVTDQDDRSFGEIGYFFRRFSQLQGIGNEGMVNFAAIVGPDEEIGPDSRFRGCVSEHGSAEAGLRYIELVERKGGVWGSICDESFADVLEEMGATAVGLKRKFQLSNIPDVESLSVRVHYPCNSHPEDMGLCEEIEDMCHLNDPNERAIVCIPPRGAPDGWEYEEETLSIFFQGDSVPGMRSVVYVTYVVEQPPIQR